MKQPLVCSGPPDDDTNARVAVAPCGLSLTALKVLNLISFVVTIALNGLSSAGVLSKYDVGAISDKYPSKITPAGPAFSIWGPIYLLQAAFVIYMLCGWPAADNVVLLSQIGLWFVGACACNSLWIVTFVHGTDVAVWVSTVLLFALLGCLLKIYTRCNMWRTTRMGHGNGKFCMQFLHVLCFDVHFSMYTGWVTVASIVNMTISLTTTGWTGAPLTPSEWSVVMQTVALLINLFLVVTRRDYVWGFVLCWASFWIACANHGDATVNTGSLAVSVIVGVASAVAALLQLVRWVRQILNATGADSAAAAAADYGATTEDPAGV